MQVRTLPLKGTTGCGTHSISGYNPTSAVHRKPAGCSLQLCDLVGYHFSHMALTLANNTIQHFRTHLRRLYEQQQAAPDRGAAVLGDYAIRWRRWATAGLDGFPAALVLPPVMLSLSAVEPVSPEGRVLCA
jgi:hypothetical protein